jgi:hypothetical protein
MHNRSNAVNPAQAIARRMNEMYSGKWTTCAQLLGVTPDQFKKALHGDAGHIHSDAAHRIITNGTNHINLMRELESGMTIGDGHTNGHTVFDRHAEDAVTVLSSPSPTMTLVREVQSEPEPELVTSFTETIIEVAPAPPPVPTKVCAACNKELPLDEFGSHNYTPDRKQTMCHSCKSELSTRSHQTRKQRLAEESAEKERARLQAEFEAEFAKEVEPPVETPAEEEADFVFPNEDQIARLVSRIAADTCVLVLRQLSIQLGQAADDAEKMGNVLKALGS